MYACVACLQVKMQKTETAEEQEARLDAYAKELEAQQQQREQVQQQGQLQQHAAAEPPAA
jgi:hypothetical protein